MKSIDKLIFNALVMHRRIFLPHVGTLVVERIKAQEKGGNRIAAPFYRVRFFREGAPEAASIVEMIERAGGADRAQAEELYRSWLEQARSSEDVAIDGVGVIRKDLFVPEKTFAGMLNPFSVGEVRMRPVKRRYGVTALLVVLFGAVIAFGWYLLCVPDSSDLRRLPAARMIAAQETEVFRRDVTADAENVQTAESSEEYIASQLEIQASNETTSETSEGKALTDAASDRAGGSPAVPAQTANSAVQGNDSRIMHDAGQPHAGRAAYYVVAGVFSTDQNADRFIASDPVKSRYGLRYHKMPFKGDKVLVGVCPSATREEAEAYRKELVSENPGLWVYQNK